MGWHIVMKPNIQLLNVLLFFISNGYAFPANFDELGTAGEISPFLSDTESGRHPPTIVRLRDGDTSPFELPPSSLSSSSPSPSSSSLNFPSGRRRQEEVVSDLESVQRREDLRSRAMDQLLVVFGVRGVRNSSSLTPPPPGRENRIAPPFMVNLYNSMADAESGLMFRPSPFNANTVRAAPDKAEGHRLWFQFDLSQVESSEVLLQAELHLFRLKPRWRDAQTHRPSFFQVHIYQLMSADDWSLEDARLIGLRLMSSRATGWEVFSIRDTVKEWLSNKTANCGLYVTVTSLSGERLPDSLLRFAKRGRHERSRQPILVLFTEDLRYHKPTQVNADEEDETINMASHSPASSGESLRTPRQLTTSTTEYHNPPSDEESRRRKRSLTRRKSQIGTASQSKHAKGQKNCSRENMNVNFEEIGWSSWVISPVRYNAYRCTGVCPFPLLTDYHPSNHATVQSIMHTMELGRNVAPPCCVPAELYPISLLYFDGEDNVVLKNIPNMIVGKCGCL